MLCLEASAICTLGFHTLVPVVAPLAGVPLFLSYNGLVLLSHLNEHHFYAAIVDVSTHPLFMRSCKSGNRLKPLHLHLVQSSLRSSLQGASQKFQSLFNAWKFLRQDQLGSSRPNATILVYYF